MQRGFTYLALLFYLAVLSAGLATVAVSWQTARQREKEEELLFAGAAIREAIALYYNRPPGGVQEFPKRLSDLLQDPRYPDARRYLRRVYRDPMTGEAKWETIAAPDGGIMGVHSSSTRKPIKVASAMRNGPDFESAKTYADWQFVYLPNAVPSNPAEAQPLPTMESNAMPPVQSVNPSSLNQ